METQISVGMIKSSVGEFVYLNPFLSISPPDTHLTALTPVCFC